jgi:hypothetical protein
MMTLGVVAYALEEHDIAGQMIDRVLDNGQGGPSVMAGLMAAAPM